MSKELEAWWEEVDARPFTPYRYHVFNRRPSVSIPILSTKLSPAACEDRVRGQVQASLDEVAA